MSAQTKPTLTERLKSLWDSYGIEVLKFGTVGGAAFIVNSVTVWVLMMTIMSESHTKAKVVASIVATIFSWLMNRLWTFRDSRPKTGSVKRSNSVWSTCSVFSLKQAVWHSAPTC